MKKIKEPFLFEKVREFLTEYMPILRRMSPNTVSAYRYTLNIYFDYVIRNHEKTLCNSTGVEYKEESEFNSFLNDEIIVDGDVNIDCPHIIDGINEFFDDSIDDSVDRYNEELGYWKDTKNKYKNW